MEMLQTIYNRIFLSLSYDKHTAKVNLLRPNFIQLSVDIIVEVRFIKDLL